MNKQIFREQARRFIKAYKDGRLICSIKSETHDRMSFTLHEIKKGYSYDFEYFLEELGFTTRRGQHIIHVGGMSKTFALTHKILKALLNENLIREATYDDLLQKEMIVL